MRGKGARTQALVAAAIEILEEVQPATVRAVCYQLFIAGHIPNMSTASTGSVSRLLRIAREEGDIPWGWIVDETRSAEYTPTWANPDAFLRDQIRGYRKDYWADQPNHVEVWSEKGTVRGTLGPVLDEYGVTFRVMHGFASATVVNDIAELSGDIGKPFIALYVGDWDPSGKFMSDADLPERLGRYGGDVDLHRIALLPSHLHNLPSFDLETKKLDARYEWFKRVVRTKCYELDALKPTDLRDLVEAEVRGLIDQPKWERAREVERVEVESMRDFHKLWQERIKGERR